MQMLLCQVHEQGSLIYIIEKNALGEEKYDPDTHYTM